MGLGVLSGTRNNFGIPLGPYDEFLVPNPNPNPNPIYVLGMSLRGSTGGTSSTIFYEIIYSWPGCLSISPTWVECHHYHHLFNMFGDVTPTYLVGVFRDWPSGCTFYSLIKTQFVWRLTTAVTYSYTTYCSRDPRARNLRRRIGATEFTSRVFTTPAV